MEENTTFFKKNWKNILLIIFSCVIVALIMSTTCTNQKLEIAENNLEAMTDTLHTYKLQNGALMYEKQGYIAKVSELESFIGVQEKEIKELQKKLKSALATISKLKAEVRVDTLVMHDSTSVDQDSVYHNYFNYTDRWLSLDGETKFQFNPFTSNTILNCINMEVPLTVGTTEDNKWFAVSENPYVVFTSVEGANLSKTKPKRFAIGLQGGVGALGGFGICGSPDGTVRYGWILGGGFYLGAGFTWKLCVF